MKKKYAVVFFLVLALDQSLKFYFIRNEEPYYNSGMAFSLFSSYPRLAFWFNALGFAGLGVLFLLVKNVPPKILLPMTLMLAGAAGNLLDRWLRGAVTDWLWIGFTHVNAADMFLAIGFLLLFCNLTKKRR